MKQLWLDARDLGATADAVRQEAIHCGYHAIVASDPADLDTLPPTVRRVLAPGTGIPDDLGRADLVLVDPRVHGAPQALSARSGGRPFGSFIEVNDAEDLAAACASARRDDCTVVRFRHPSNIPLEIMLAAADRADGAIITVADRVDDALVHFSVLEHGPTGVMLRPEKPGEAGRLKDLVEDDSPQLSMAVLTVTGIEHVGTGERACVDTCTYFGVDEGILVGSRAKGMVLCVSETHPLPYMRLRPFRVNAGAVMSYTLIDQESTRYLSELSAGAGVLAVRADGRSRRVTVGRVKIERRPLLSINAVGEGGEQVNVIVQDDWHVRVMAPDGTVLNSTELRPGDRILGYLADRERHVGYPIDELCYEQ